MKYFKKTMCMLLASATLLTGCSIGGKEIVLDINTTNNHTVFSVDNMKCDKTEALIYLANYKNLYGTMYDVNLLETDDASNVEKYIREHGLERTWKVSQNPKNLGYAANFISAVKETVGEYIFFCDQDDIWVPDRVEVMVGQMEEFGIRVFCVISGRPQCSDMGTEAVPPGSFP